VSDFLKHYLEHGLSEIIFESSKTSEKGNAYGRETTTETVVARKGNQYVRVVAIQRDSFAPRAAGSSSGVDSETVITLAAYKVAAKGRAILDSAEALQALKQAEENLNAHYAKQAAIREKQAPLGARLEKLTPKCDNCDGAMTIKTKNGRRFWACPRYPQRCNGGIKNLTAEVVRLLADIENIG
jgi:hypothetical protein